MREGASGPLSSFFALVSRVHGRPVKKVESTTETAEGLSLDELRALRARLLRKCSSVPPGPA
jgi:hypothetical protein